MRQRPIHTQVAFAQLLVALVCAYSRTRTQHMVEQSESHPADESPIARGLADLVLLLPGEVVDRATAIMVGPDTVPPGRRSSSSTA